MKMELGPLQKAWVKELREHPERQLVGFLGKGSVSHYKACCLGQLHVCAKGSEAFEGGIIEDSSEDSLFDSFEKYGLFTCNGAFVNSVIIKDAEYCSLALMNDNGLSWPEIADYIENNPENIFRESV